MKSSISTCVLFLISTLMACAHTSPIQLVDASSSSFEGSVYGGKTAIVGRETPGFESYRVFHQGATGFVSVNSVRQSAEKRAITFCDNKEMAINTIRETTSVPPHIAGNFPRIEIVFQCVPRLVRTDTIQNTTDKYSDLIKLKDLLEQGILTNEEFDIEKAKVLNQP